MKILLAVAEQLTAGVSEKLGASGLTAETSVRDGDTRAVIVDEAKDWGADLIVVVSHGYTGGWSKTKERH